MLAEIEFLRMQAADDLPMKGGLRSCLSDRICMILLHAVLIYNMCLSETLHMAASRRHIQGHNQDNWSFHIVLIDCL